MMFKLSAPNMRGMYIVPLIYLRRRFSFPQASSYGCLTLVVRNDTVMCMSLRERDDAKSSWATA
jgi:hypothetical protein